MDPKLELDINHLFSVFQSRTEEHMEHLPAASQKELAEELDLLRQSVLNRVAEDGRQ